MRNFRGKLIVILAGYDQEMNDLLQVNTGLSSRFPEEIVFPNIAPAKCLEILDRKLRKEGVVLPALSDSSQPANANMIKLIEKLSVLPSWGNARDMETLAKKMCEVAFTREDIVTGWHARNLCGGCHQLHFYHARPTTGPCQEQEGYIRQRSIATTDIPAFLSRATNTSNPSNCPNDQEDGRSR
jgi:hypothetical protein